MPRRDETPEFNFGPEETRGIQPAIAQHSASSGFDSQQVHQSTWREVPQARFLSWSPAMQAAYCRDRDLDSAEHADDEEWEQFYLARANVYDEMARIQA